MSEQKPPIVEWSFSFDDIHKRIHETFDQVGERLRGNVEPAKTDSFTVVREGVTSAHIHLGASVGATTVKALSESASLFEAQVTHVGELEYSVTGEAEKHISLRQKSNLGNIGQPLKDALSGINNRKDLRWEIGLAMGVPLALHVAAGVGSSFLDLRGLTLTHLDVDGGVGEVKIALPANTIPYKVEVDSGVGGLNLSVQEGASVKIVVNNGVGGVKIAVPENAAVRATVASGLGGAHFPERFSRVKGGADFIAKSGMWETAGYSLATQQIEIEFNGGVGGLTVS